MRGGVVPVLLAVLIVAPGLSGCLLPTSRSTGPDGNGHHGGNGTGLGPASFNATRAYGYVVEQVQHADGSPRYRIPGTAGSRQAADIIVEHLQMDGWNVTRDRWNASYMCNRTELQNIVAVLPGRTNRTLILGAHYDTRPWADDDPAGAPTNHTPVLGAGDGASGVAVLLELAHVLAHAPRGNLTIRLVFLDAEDGGDPPRWAGCHGNPWLLGSRHDAGNLTDAQVRRTAGFVLVDLVGDPNATFQREGYSSRSPNRPLQDLIWSEARSLHVARFTDTRQWTIIDDHVPYIHRFQGTGEPAVDIIDLRSPNPFPPWHHTTHDTPAHVSPGTLADVGRVLVASIRALESRSPGPGP